MVFVIAGASKAFSPSSLARILTTVTSVPLSQVNARLTARTVGILELTSAVMILLALRIGAVIGMVIGLGIVGVVLQAKRRRVTAPCGCFGGNSTKPLGTRNAVAGILLTAGFGVLAFSGQSAQVLRPADKISLVALASLALVLGLRYSDLHPPIRKGLGIGR